MPYAYALQTRSAHSDPSLVEVTRGELQAYADLYKGDPEADTIYPALKRVSGEYAHRWVMQGGHHATGLYIGEDRRGRTRVRYARDDLGS